MTIVERKSFIDYCKHNFFESNGYITCIKCGYTLPDKIYEQTNYYMNRDGKKKTFYTQISKRPQFSTGCRTGFNLLDIPKNKYKLFSRLSKLNNQGSNTSLLDSNSVFYYVREMDRICKKYRLPYYIQQEVISLFIKVKKKKLLLGRSFIPIAWVIIYIICRMRICQHGFVMDEIEEAEVIPSPLLSLKRISKLENIPLKKLNNAFSLIWKSFRDIKLPKIPIEYRLYEVSRSLKKMGYTKNGFYNKLIGYIDVIRDIFSLSILKQKDPIIGILAFIYVYKCELELRKINQTVLSKIGNITEVTFRNYTKPIKEYRKRNLSMN